MPAPSRRTWPALGGAVGNRYASMMGIGRRPALFLAAAGAVLFCCVAGLAWAQGTETTYRTFFGVSPRLAVWVIAEVHLMFAAFVLGVPVFSVIVEFIGHKTGDTRYDDLAHEFTRLLSAAFSTTAAFGALLTFALFTLYPRFMDHMSTVFSPTFYIYVFLFFAEAFTLYLYYYSWHAWDRGWKKSLHIFLGVLLNLVGTTILFVADGWATYMMSPTGIDKETGEFIGTAWQALSNPLWMPLNIHRLVANVALGGLVAAAYAATKFLGARSPEEKAHYDWMGYIGNFVALASMIPLPFAGYYMGREVYSASPVMGNNMMGGAFSWAFILQAALIGMLFIGANFYLWIGMHRIEGSERYSKYIKYLLIILLLCFAVWLTPHNLPLSPREQIQIGGQYHPLLKYLGLMPAKNAVINFILTATFVSFLIYRRANKGEGVPFSRQGAMPKIVLSVVGALTLYFLSLYFRHVYHLDPATMDLAPEKARYFRPVAWLLIEHMAVVAISIGLTFYNRGKLAQVFLLGMTVFNTTLFLGPYGFVVMSNANPFLREISVSQFLMLINSLVVCTAIDVFLFRGAPAVGRIHWGRMPARSQYALIFLCVTAVMTMGLMGYIRSGLREDWHVYGVVRDTSDAAFTPTMAYMAWTVGACVLIFLALVSFVFWLGSLDGKTRNSAAVGTGPSPHAPPHIPPARQ